MEAVLALHRFRVGESVHFTSGMAGRGGASGVYEVVRLLPQEGDEQQYRIKSATEPHERVASKSARTHGVIAKPSACVV